MKTRCERCGAAIVEGALRYVVTVHATADFDGNRPTEGDIQDLEAYMRRMDAPSQKPDHDVYQSKAFILCPACKGEIMKNPVGVPEPDPGAGTDEEGRIH